jgi:hypothetical protein
MRAHILQNEVLMLQLSRIVFVVFAIMLGLSPAIACSDVICFAGTFRGYPLWRPHNFRPHLRDGIPVVKDYQDYPVGFHGIGCVSSWRLVPTPTGPAWALVPFCVDY